MDDMQMVILAGGLGTRMRPLTRKLPKALIPVDGKPFLQYQIELLREQGISDIVVCIGHLGEKVKQHFNDGHDLGVSIRYSAEHNGLLGTAGAIKNAEPLLEDDFFLMYGDSYLPLDYPQIMRYFRRLQKLGLMMVYRNANRYQRSNVVVGGHLVRAYDKEGRTPGMVYINHGLSILRKEALRLIPAGRPSSQEEFYQTLIDRRELLAFETWQRFYEIGSPEGLREFERLVASRGVAA